ncbi:glycosyltransferase [Yeosuana marina]|uniref:glycosyltransferase n=1 Tax=Yeosuana marina TaxID=1565536 RepID=UPI0030C80653
MEQQRNRVAIVAPALNAYSETFIQAHKERLNAQIHYYYGGFLPLYLEHYGKLMSRSALWSVKIRRKLGFTTFNVNETAFISSLKKNKIQLVLAQYGNTGNRIVQICKHLNIPMITHFHGYDASKFSVIEACKNYKEVFLYSSYIIVVSILMEKQLTELGCPKEKVIYNPYGPDPSFLDIKPLFTKTTFIGLGRFVDKKAPYYNILAFKQAVDQFPHARLVLGGQGELFEVCKNLVRYLKIEDNVIFPGVLTKEEFSGYLSEGLAFVQHSVTAIDGNQEGTPVAILEASAAGVPVISTIHAGIPDVIKDGETGFLVPEHNVDAMAEKMILLIENKLKAMQMGKNGKERIATHFTLEQHIHKIDMLIDKAIYGNL